MKKIMFVCLGNVCRSPSAELITEKLIEDYGLGEYIRVASAGTHELAGGEPIYPEAGQELKDHGIACDRHISARLEPEDYEKYDLFVGMDNGNVHDMIKIFRGDPEKKIVRLLDYTERGGVIDDPYFTRRFSEAYGEILEGCTALISRLFPDRLFIRPSLKHDYYRLLGLYDRARDRMREGGNPTQWGDDWPPEELIADDITDGIGRVVLSDGKVVGGFIVADGPDPTYLKIDGGEWLNDEPYCVIHRIAGDGKTKGILKAAVTYALGNCDNVRMDTHEDNAIMNHLLPKLGFVKCGVIYVRNGEPRVAYHLKKDAAKVF